MPTRLRSFSPRSVQAPLSIRVLYWRGATGFRWRRGGNGDRPNHAEAVTAFNRFGLGTRPGDLDAAAADPRGLLLEELWTADAALIRNPALPSGPKAFETYYLDQQQLRVARMEGGDGSAAPSSKFADGGYADGRRVTGRLVDVDRDRKLDGPHSPAGDRSSLCVQCEARAA
jgi:hypothetical protein